jgi:hypothetical protein
MTVKFNGINKLHSISKEHSPELQKQPRVKNEKKKFGPSRVRSIGLHINFRRLICVSAFFIGFDFCLL